MKVSRRGFLQIAGVSVAGQVASGCKVLERGYPEEYSVDKPPVPGTEGWAQGEERLIKSTCMQCEGGCGIIVRVVEGRAVRIKGNPDYPTNQGGLCPKGLNGLQVLYDPDRIEGPLQRVGARGAGNWKRISWDEAIAHVARQLAALRANGESHTLAVLGGRYRGHMRDLVRRFLTAYGSPNDIDHESLCTTGDKVAAFLAQGIRDRLAYDWERTKYVLVFGAGFIESFRPTAMMLRIHGHMRQGVPGQRTKIVQIDPRYGVSAARADEWVQVRPGTDGALALGLAHVLIRDGLVHKKFIRNHTLGFDSWTDSAGRSHMGFEDLVLSNYSPASVAETTGIAAETIERLAHEFAAHQPGVAIVGRGAAAHTNGVYNVLAIHALNALVGSIDVAGGVLVQRQPPFASWPDPELDGVARLGRARPRFDLDGGDAPPFADSQLSTLAERLEWGQPYRLKAVFFYYTNPLFSAPAPDRLRAALERVPLLVSFSPFMDESTAMADFVLPDHTYLERWQLDVISPSVGFPLFSIRQPVVAPLHDTRSTGEALIEIARAIGGTVGRSFPGSELEMIKQLVRGAQESKRGSIRTDDFEEFWKQLLTNGGWWDQPYSFGEWHRVLATPSGKYEFYSTRLDERLRALAAAGREQDPEAAVLVGLAASGRWDEACLPHYEPIRSAQSESEFPFIVASYKTMTHAEGRGANQPHLQEAFGVQFDRSWEPWVEIHPDDAHALGVHDDDEVWLRAPSGQVRVKAVLHDGTHRGTVNVPFEYGHTAYGRWAAGRGENVNPLVRTAQVSLAGGAAWYDARVAISKA
ncbi:MAG: molybdopterin-dependent oxidoreductase [Deltaproteobacteria bacterium]|nr:molybdopterin-dependent oxidoreductase [Deltaproteobacteria bacterium]